MSDGWVGVGCGCGVSRLWMSCRLNVGEVDEWFVGEVVDVCVILLPDSYKELGYVTAHQNVITFQQIETCLNY